jgi:hypothetical protein
MIRCAYGSDLVGLAVGTGTWIVSRFVTSAGGDPAFCGLWLPDLAVNTQAIIVVITVLADLAEVSGKLCILRTSFLILLFLWRRRQFSAILYFRTYTRPSLSVVNLFQKNTTLNETTKCGIHKIKHSETRINSIILYFLRGRQKPG